MICTGGGDEPEDIPKALEKYIEDCKTACMSADHGVHVVFFIADAGFRRNEDARVVRALESLRKMGIVLTMCRVRGGPSLNTMVERAQTCFQEVGQFAELSGVGQLAAIASSVTESIRASLFESAVVSVTASVGSTIDSLRKLASFQRDHASLKETEEFVALEDTAEEKEKEEAPKVYAEQKELRLTSRDRLYLQLSRLPKVSHEVVAACFGGKTLQEMSAEAIATRMRSEGIPLAEAQKAGYPDDLLELVRNLLAGHGVARVEKSLNLTNIRM